MNSHTKPFRFRSAFGLAITVCFAVLAAFSQGQTTVAQGLQEVKAEDIVGQIEDGKAINLAGATIVGNLDLSGVEIVHRPIRCQGCSFRGAILASHLIFNGVLDLEGSQFQGMINLGGSQFQGPVIFQGAIFESALLFRATEQQPTKFFDTAVFSYADFGETAGFESVQFEKDADFVAARFGDDASFANANFNQVSDFDDARFDGNVTFTGQSGYSEGSDGACIEGGIIEGMFKDRVTFRRATFKGHADFRQRCFEGEAILERANFGDRADFSQTLFAGTESNFNGASFGESSSFIAAIFDGEASFVHAASRGPLEFDFARFRAHANFFHLSSTGAISIRGVTFEHQATMNGLSTSDLMMDKDDVSRIIRYINSDEIQREILSTVRSSAQRRGDLALANEAEYTRLSLENKDLDGPISYLDSVVMQGFFGYFVRPLHPLLTLLTFIGVGWAARTARYFVDSRPLTWVRLLRGRLGLVLFGTTQYLIPSKSQSGSEVEDTPKSPATVLYASTLQVEKDVAGILGALATTIAVAFKIKPDIEPVGADTVLQYLVTGLRWTEFLVYKILTIAFLIGLGNSNPAIHELIDAIL
jgi:uncharacterized protein YjbI with pentapeptide repeats